MNHTCVNFTGGVRGGIEVITGFALTTGPVLTGTEGNHLRTDEIGLPIGTHPEKHRFFKVGYLETPRTHFPNSKIDFNKEMGSTLWKGGDFLEPVVPRGGS